LIPEIREGEPTAREVAIDVNFSKKVISLLFKVSQTFDNAETPVTIPVIAVVADITLLPKLE
jgi:hypothetical protein